MSNSSDASTAVNSSPKVTPTPTPSLVRSVYVWLGLLMLAMAVVGFWPSYFGPLAYGTLEMHWALDLHAAVFSGWLFLFLGQAVLGSQGRIRTHQSIGSTVGISAGLLLLAVGIFVTLAVIVPGVGDANHTPEAFSVNLLLSLGDLFTFGVLFGAGMLYRNRPPVHKRLMVLATVALMGAPAGRLFGGAGLHLYLGARLSPAVLAISYDRWRRGRVHPAYWIGAALLLLNSSRVFVVRTEAWQAVSTWVLHRMRPVVEALLAG